MNQFNALHGEELNEPPIEWNIRLPETHLKSRTSPTKNSPVVSAIMVGINNHAIDNGDVKVQPSEFPVNLTPNKFQIQTPLLLNQLMMMEWNISCNYSTQNIMKTFWMLTSRCFMLYWWLPLLQNFIQFLLCCFINM